MLAPVARSSSDLPGPHRDSGRPGVGKAALRAGFWLGCSKHVCRCLGGDGNLGSVSVRGTWTRVGMATWALSSVRGTRTWVGPSR